LLRWRTVFQRMRVKSAAINTPR
ncbi:DUF2492 domain-containing protein, partial [Salmonella enterica]|nr:DUF2492 domain-containing protein [Salmonella enterica]